MINEIVIFNKIFEKYKINNPERMGARFMLDKDFRRSYSSGSKIINVFTDLSDNKIIDIQLENNINCYDQIELMKGVS